MNVSSACRFLGSVNDRMESSVVNLIRMGALPVLVLLGVALVIPGRSGKPGQGILASLLFTMSGLLLIGVLDVYQIASSYWGLTLVSLVAFAVIPVLVVLYARHVVRPQQGFSRRDMGYGIPALIVLVGMGILLSQRGSVEQVTLVEWRIYALGIQGLALVCGIAVWRMWRTSRKESWIAATLGMFGVHWLFSAIGWALALSGGEHPVGSAVFESLSLLALLAFGGTAVVLGIQRLPALAPPPPDPYAEAGLAPDLLSEKAAMLHQLMCAQRPYLDPALSAAGLAAHARVTPRELSQILSLKMGEGFFDYVNRWRVEEAKRLLADSDHRDVTILHILYAAGFNSKSAFHRAFRKHVGQTPSAYRQAAQASVDVSLAA